MLAAERHYNDSVPGVTRYSNAFCLARGFPLVVKDAFRRLLEWGACVRLLCVWMPGTCMMNYPYADEALGPSAEKVQKPSLGSLRRRDALAMRWLQ